MVKLTQSFTAWCLKFHRDLHSPLMFGRVELMTQELYDEYLTWVQTDEGRQYLKGGSKYKEEGNEAD